MKLKQLFILLLFINSISLISFIFILSDYQNAIKELEDAYKMQYRSFVLADELRQSSDDLTRMARTYVITGNDMFKEQFQSVLDIRNGQKARPKYYNRIYWDLFTLKESNNFLNGKKTPLRRLMKEAGFPDEELELLYKSQKESDELTNLEEKAMNAIKGVFQDKNGEFTINSNPDYTLASKIMYSDDYHKAKITIMKPLNEFYNAFENRTQKKVTETHETVKRMETYLSLAVLFLIILFIFSFFFVILYRIIHPLEILNKGMLKLAKNDMDIVLPQRVFMDEVSQMIGAVEVFKNNAIDLISSQQQNKRLLDLAAEGIFGLDSKGRFVFLNPMASKLLGYSSEELIGKYINKSIGKHFFKKGAQQRERLMLNEKDELTFLSKLGKEFPVDYVSTPIYSNKELLEGSVVVFSDITERKEYENKLKKATVEAQKANMSKSIFLTNMSHELRTPLNAILGFTTLLEKSSTISNQEKENIQIIKKSGQHLLSIINEILEFAKIEAGKISINLKVTNLDRLIEDIELLFSQRCSDKNLKFNLFIDKNVPKFIECDETRVRQVFINILGNAVKFTDVGEINVYINFQLGKLKVKISDTGIGIDKKSQKLIFKPFEQIEESKYKHKGTGLGLSITKELIEKMNGKISFVSKIGVGTTFDFEIEVKEANSLKEVISDHSKEVISVKDNYNDFKILVVDDTKENRELLVKLLHSYNIKTYEAKDGLEALDISNRIEFDLIFMDILMPNLDGLETITILKKSVKHIPIVANSANVFDDDRQKAIDVGADYFLTKPFEEKDITKSLEKFLDMNFSYKIENKEEVEKTFKLNKDLIEKLLDASIRLDANLINKIIENDDIDPIFKNNIKNLLSEYRFDEIVLIVNKYKSNV